MNLSKEHLARAITFLVIFCGAGGASAELFTWTGEAGTNGWYDVKQVQFYPLPELYVNNWGRTANAPAYPGAADDVVIGDVDVVLNGGGNGIFELNSLSLATGGVISSAENLNRMFRVRADCVLDGEFRFGAAGTATSFAILDDVLVSGNGTFIFTTNDIGNILFNSADAAVLTLGSGITVCTADVDSKGSACTTLVNHGTIDADQGYIYLYQKTKTNDGLIRARNGGMVQLGTTLTNTAGGVIRVGEGSTLDLYRGTVGGLYGWVAGGTIEGDGGAGGEVTVTYLGRLDGVTLNDVTVQVSNGDELAVTGNLTNNATIRLADTDAYYGAVMRIWEDQTIDGAGTILFDSPHQNFIADTGSPPTKTLTLGADQTLRVSPGAWGQVSTHLTNHGTIEVDGDLEMYLARTLTNASDGRLTGGGTITLPIAAVLVNHGTIAPGHSAGLLKCIGTFNQSASGVLEIDLAGDTPGDLYDRLEVTGSASLAGLLDVVLDPGFQPAPGDTFDVLTATDTLNDDGLVLSPEDAATWQLNWSANILQIEYVIPEPATLGLLVLGGLGMIRRRRFTTV